MYVAAGLCMWFLRGWKIQQTEQITAEKGSQIAESIHDQEVSPTKKGYRSNLLKGFFVCEKV